MAWEWLMPLGGAVAGGPIGAAFGAQWAAADQQADAAKEAAAAQIALTQEQMANLEDAGYTANNLLYDAAPGVADWMRQGYEAGADFLTQGLGGQRNDILGGGQLATGAISQGMGGSLDALYGGADQGIGALMNRQDRAGGMLDRMGGLYGDLEMDPGFEFRRDQGEDALRRIQAARGGRFGGAAGQALLEYNQNFASNEFDKAAGRRLNEFGAASSSDAMGLNATSQAANMAYGAGQGAANVYGQGADRLAGIYGGVGSQLGAQSANAGNQLGALTQDYYGGLGNLDWNLAQQIGGNIMTGAGAAAGLTGQANAAIGSTVPYAGSGWAAIGNGIGRLEELGVTVLGAQAGK